jgi:hypothetical protein
MTQINIRIPQELKTKAMQKAQAEGLSISTLIVQFLQSYTDGEPMANWSSKSFEKHRISRRGLFKCSRVLFQNQWVISYV